MESWVSPSIFGFPLTRALADALSPARRTDDRTTSPSPPPAPASFHHFASASSAWLFPSRDSKPHESPVVAPQPRRPPPTPSTLLHDKLQPLSDGMTDMWEKAKAGSNRLYIPLGQLQMPELTAFQSMAHSVPAAFSKSWRGGKVEQEQEQEEGGGGGETGAESDVTVMPASARPKRSFRGVPLGGGGGEEDEKAGQGAGAGRDWRTLYGAPSWFKSPSSPPPMYSATDMLQGAKPISSSPRTPTHSLPPPLPSPPTTTPVASTSKLPMSAPLKQGQLQLQRQGSKTLSSSNAGRDLMLYAFCALPLPPLSLPSRAELLTPPPFRNRFAGLPVLLVVFSMALYTNFDLLRPVMDYLVDAVLPRSVGRTIR